jgi:hypothetical protein
MQTSKSEQADHGKQSPPGSIHVSAIASWFRPAWPYQRDGLRPCPGDSRRRGHGRRRRCGGSALRRQPSRSPVSSRIYSGICSSRMSITSVRARLLSPVGQTRKQRTWKQTQISAAEKTSPNHVLGRSRQQVLYSAPERSTFLCKL